MCFCKQKTSSLFKYRTFYSNLRNLSWYSEVKVLISTGPLHLITTLYMPSSSDNEKLHQTFFCCLFYFPCKKEFKYKNSQQCKIAHLMNMKQKKSTATETSTTAIHSSREKQLFFCFFLPKRKKKISFSSSLNIEEAEYCLHARRPAFK